MHEGLVPPGLGKLRHRKDLLEISQLTRQDIEDIFNTATSIRSIIGERFRKTMPTLRGRTVALLFFEPSTRTQMSFTLAARRLGCDLISLSASSSSILKGETVLDTARNIEAMDVDFVVVRHSAPGIPHLLARHLSASVINAGDGTHEHPTQALLDAYTIWDYFRKRNKPFNHLRILILGDILHSRVARSDISAFKKLGADVAVCGPPTLIPYGIEELGVQVYYNLPEALADRDIIYTLRIQRERQEGSYIPTLREYIKLYGLNHNVLRKYAREDVVIMHPGPVNRGVELSPELADDPNLSLILPQVNNGVFIRMAIFYLFSPI